MIIVDWGVFQQCAGCGALLGKPCRSLTGFVAASGWVEVEADRPHGGRKLRAGHAR